MQNLTVHPGGPSTFLLGPDHARPHSRTPVPMLFPRPLTGRPCLSAARPPGTVPLPTRHCAAHVARERHTRATTGRRPPIGAGPHGTPTPRGTPHAWTTHFFRPLFPSAALPPSHSLTACAAPLVLPSPLLSDPSSRVPEPPHRSPHPDRRLQPSAAHSPSRIPAEHRRCPPLPGELLPSYQSLQFLAFFSPPCLSGAAGPHTHRRHPLEPPPRRRTPPPDAVCTASPSTRRSGAPLPSPPCPTPSL
jgi:hypothetical protein